MHSPEPLVAVEVHHHDDPARSVRLTSERAPYLPAADVLLTGHAVAPNGGPVTSMTVRLTVVRERPLLEKSIHVYGDARGSARAPFERMPLVYEHAYGGIGYHDNPLGVGAGTTGGKAPNLVDPRDPKRVACFAPISRGWPSRKRLLGGLDRGALEAPIVEIPASFDWTYYHAAPADPRIGYLEGDEWIVIEGFHAAAPRVRSRLPGVSAAARVDGLSGHAAGLWLRLAPSARRTAAPWKSSRSGRISSLDTHALLRGHLLGAGSLPLYSADAFSSASVSSSSSHGRCSPSGSTAESRAAGLS